MINLQWQSKIEKWCRERPLRLCVLFGSQATGKAHDKSDVDLALWLAESMAPMTKVHWLVELERLLDKEVNLVIVTPDLDPVLGFEIVRDGRLFYERTPDSWRKARSQLWHTYNDSLPFRRAAREQLRQYAEEIRRGS